MTDEIKDYRVTVKVRNARIIKALEEKGEVVGAKAAAKIGISYSKLLALSNLALSPIDKDGNIIPEVLKLCDFTNKLPLDLFSPDQIVPLETNTAEVDMTADEVETLMLSSNGNVDPERRVIDFQGSQVIKDLLETLTPMENKVLRLRFGIDCDAHTHTEIAEFYDLSNTRIGQIEAKALRKLRQPFRARQIAAVIPEINVAEKKEANEDHQ